MISFYGLSNLLEENADNMLYPERYIGYMLPLDQAEKVKAGQVWLKYIMESLSVVLPRWCQYMSTGVTVALEDFDQNSPNFILQIWKQVKPFYDDFNNRLTQLLEVAIPSLEKKVNDIVGVENLNTLKSRYVKNYSDKYKLPETRNGRRISDVEDTFYSLMTSLTLHFKDGPVFTIGTPAYMPPEAISKKVQGKTVGGSNEGKEFNYLSEVNILITFVKELTDEKLLADRVKTLSARLEKGIYTLIRAYKSHHHDHMSKEFKKFTKKPLPKGRVRAVHDLKYEGDPV